MKKKILSGICAAAICMTSIIVPAAVYAAPAAEIRLEGDNEIVPGEEVTFNINLDSNSGMRALELSVKYDGDVLEYVKDKSQINEWEENGVYKITKKKTADELVFTWAAGSTTYSENGKTATVTFKVKDTAAVDSTCPIDLEVTGAVGADGSKITAADLPTCEDETLTVVAAVPQVTYTAVPAKAATCTAEGNKEYYKGSDGKYYADAEGKTETTLAAVTIKALGHDYKDGVCTRCGEKDPNYTAPVVVTYEKVPAKAATCTATGNIEYYKGSDGKLYTLGNKKYTETTLAEVTTDKVAHNYVDGVCTVCSEKDPGYNPVVVTYYAVNFTGEYIGSGVTVTGSRAAGAVMTLNVPVGYSATVVSGSNRITTVTDGTGTFTMPAANVTVKVESYLGALSTGYKNAYIYSYDKDMNYIKTNSVRGGMTSPEGEVTVKLGSDYAGRSVTLYNGRKNTSSKVDEAELDSKGEAAFSVKSGKNYTLVVD